MLQLDDKEFSKEDFVHILRRHGNGFSRGGPKYRGVPGNKCDGYEARMAPFVGNKFSREGRKNTIIIGSQSVQGTKALPSNLPQTYNGSSSSFAHHMGSTSSEQVSGLVQESAAAEVALFRLCMQPKIVH